MDLEAEAQDELMEGIEPQDLTIEAAPQSPTPSILLSDAAHPSPSDAGIETADVDDPVAGGDKGMCLAGFGVAGVDQSCGFTKQLRKRVMGSDDEGGEEREPLQKPQKKRAKGSDDESGEERALSRSADAS